MFSTSKPKSKSKPSAQIKSANQLAQRLKVHRATVGRWIKSPAWKWGRAPWSGEIIPDVLRWASAEMERRIDNNDTSDGGQSERTGAMSDELRALRSEKIKTEIRKLTTQAERAQLALDAEKGRLCDAAVIRGEIKQALHILTGSLLALPSQTVNQIRIAQDDEEGKDVLDRAIRETLRILKKSWDQAIVNGTDAAKAGEQ